MFRRVRGTVGMFEELGYFIGDRNVSAIFDFLTSFVRVDSPHFVMDIEVTAGMDASRGKFNEYIIKPLRYSIVLLS